MWKIIKIIIAVFQILLFVNISIQQHFAYGAFSLSRMCFVSENNEHKQEGSRLRFVVYIKEYLRPLCE